MLFFYQQNQRRNENFNALTINALSNMVHVPQENGNSKALIINALLTVYSFTDEITDGMKSR
jgi:hypothetical protein